MKNSKFNTLNWTMLKIAFLPMIVISLIVAIAGSYFVDKSLKREVREGMIAVCDTVTLSMEKMYPGEYHAEQGLDGLYFLKGDHQFNTDFEYIDQIKEATGCDVTICVQNIAVITTLRGIDGNRKIGYADNDVINTDIIVNGLSKFYDEVYSDNQQYYAYYSPLRAGDGSVVGMICVLKNADYASGLVWGAIASILIITFIACVAVSIFVLRFSRRFIQIIRKVQRYMSAIAREDFRADMDPEVLKQQNELGQMAKSAMSMAASLRLKVEEDQLTQLYNRRSADKKIKKTITDYVDTGMKFCLALGDIDFFKKVNDTYGHEAGDDVLKAVASTLKNFMSDKGYAIRWGGEEFILVYNKNKSIEEVALMMETLLDKVRALLIVNNGNEIKVNMTFGLVDCSILDMNDIPAKTGNAEADMDARDAILKSKMDAYISAADMKLYYGKEHGRNQLVLDMPAEE